MAGIIGATAGNGHGIAGINWISKMLVVRMADAKGSSGTVETEVDALRWAAGIPVPGLPNNPSPARIINFSAAGLGSCTQAEMDAINEIRAKGTVVIAAAGNNNMDVSGSAPANCPGVIAVAAIDPAANRASFSNYGPGITISAPGQEVITTGDTQSPPSSSAYAAVSGTSVAAPVVSGVVSLMLSVNPGLSPDDVTRLLKQSAQPFPPGANCNGICQAGILDAGKAVALAAGQGTATPGLRALVSPAQTVPPGQRVTLTGGGKTVPGARIVSYLWRQVGGPPVRFANAHAARTVIIAPQQDTSMVFQLTVTDSQGRTAGAATQVTVAGANAAPTQPAPSPAPAPAPAPTPAPTPTPAAPVHGGIFGGGPGTLLNTPTQ